MITGSIPSTTCITGQQWFGMDTCYACLTACTLSDFDNGMEYLLMGLFLENHYVMEVFIESNKFRNQCKNSLSFFLLTLNTCSIEESIQNCRVHLVLLNQTCQNYEIYFLEIYIDMQCFQFITLKAKATNISSMPIAWNERVHLSTQVLEQKKLVFPILLMST